MVEFRLLGPFEVLSGGVTVPIKARKQRTLLAALLLKANFLVRSEELITYLWEDRPPADGRAALQVHVTRLRRFLNSLQDGDAVSISTQPGGYLIKVSPDLLDVGRFIRLAQQSTLARREQQPAAESALLHQALGLWRGPALADVPSWSLQQDQVLALVEQRLRLAERWFDIELELGHHADVIGELRELAAGHPLRERLWGQLMLALYRCERQAEALQAYRKITRLLRDELGIAPGEPLAKLHRAILLGDPALQPVGGKNGERPTPDPPSPETGESAAGNDVARRAPVPRNPAQRFPQSGEWLVQCQLPSDTDDFVGRHATIARMTALLTPDRPAAVPIVRLSGSPGAGKTMLAVHVAHQLRSAYPDGQWYVRLGGAGDQPRSAAEVLAELLCASGMASAAVPEGLDARAAVFRAWLADRRVLLVLDDAGTADQVLPLLPGTPGSAVVVTSRSQLPELVALSGARTIAVDVLSAEEAVILLTRVLGAERVSAEPAAVAEVAQLCACLPLALRIAAANLASRPHRTITEYVAELRNGNLLGKLAVGSEARVAVRAAFDLSYRTLSGPLQRLFRQLGLTPGPELTIATAARLAGIGDDEAEQLLHGLADAHLVEPLTDGRFRFHDLLRLYAADRARAEDPESERTAALRRLYDWYLYSADRAQRKSCPGFARIKLPASSPPPKIPSFEDPREALAWLQAEWRNLVAMIVHAPGGELRSYSWQLADILSGYFAIDRHYNEWLATARAGLAAAEAEGDAYATGITQLNLGLVTAHFLADSTDAVGHLRAALQHFRTIDAADLQALTLNAVGMLHLHKNHGRLDDAVPLLEEALAIARSQGNQRVELESLRNLGVLHHARGDLTSARCFLTEALRAYRNIGLPHVAPDLLARIGLVECDHGLLDDADRNLRQSLAASTDLKAVNLQSVAHYGLARMYIRRDQHEEARKHAQEGRRLAVAVQFPAVEISCLAVLGELETTTGNRDAALGYFDRGLSLARQMGHEQVEIEALLGLAWLHATDRRTALPHANEALTMTRRSGFRLLEGRALAVLTHLHGEQGAPARNPGGAPHARPVALPGTVTT